MVDKKLIVVKHNDLIKAAYKLSILESRIVLSCIARINSKGMLSSTDKFSIHVSEIADLVPDHSNLYINLKDAVDRLSERWVYFLEPSSRSREMKTRWVYSVDYVHDEGRINLFFSPHIIPFLSELTRDFTQYKLEHVSRFKSSYSIGFYELFKSYQSSKKILTIDWIKEHFQIEDKYDRTDSLQLKVIKPAMEDINNHSDMKVEWKSIKQGRKIVSFEFTFVTREDNSRKISKKFDRDRIEGVLKADLDKYANPGESYSQAATRLKAEQLMLEKTGKPTTLDILWK
ncbi:MAG: hypothetical protein RLZZ66_1419, partial [Pseudomonadota bacterium]|jgi:plasmid replication initiation protein